MSNLTENIQEVTAADPPSFLESYEVANERSPALLIYQWNEILWVMPWAYFTGARYQPNVKNEHQPDDPIAQIELTFTDQIVTIQGRNLRGVLEAINDFYLRVICETPKEFIDIGLKEGRTVIIGIQVQMRKKENFT